MRRIGFIALLLGIGGFYYSSSRLAETPSRNDTESISAALRDEGGRWELARYGSAAIGGFGLLVLVAPKGR
jgi:hypothetical protein